MRTIVVSLKSATERRLLVEKEFNRLNLPFCFYDAIDGNALSDEQIRCVDADAMYRMGRYHPLPGSVANWLTQMSILTDFSVSDDTMLAIFEDDVRLEKDLGQVLSALADDMHGFDIVKLSWRKKHRKYYKCVNLLPSYSIGIINGYDNGSDAYVISRRAAQTLVNSFPRMTWNMDHLITRYWETNLTVGILSPPVVNSDAMLDSQISKDNYARQSEGETSWKINSPPKWRRYRADIITVLRMKRARSSLIAKYKSRM